MKTQEMPLALRLAEDLEKRHEYLYGEESAPSCLTEAASELHRLHRINNTMVGNIFSLQETKQELLEALQRILPFIDCIAAVTREEIIEYEAAMKMADAAIKKATGQE